MQALEDMHPLSDVSSPLDGMEQADVIMHLSTAPIAAASQPQQQQQGQQKSVQGSQQQKQQAKEQQVQPVVVCFTVLGGHR